MLGAVRSWLGELAMSHVSTTLKQMHSIVSSSALPSFHKDVAVGSLLTAMHKYGPSTQCHQLENADQIKDVLRKVKWASVAPAEYSGSTANAVTRDEPSNQLESSINALSEQMEALTASIDNKLRAVDSSSSIPADHIVIPKDEMHELLNHLEQIKTAPISYEDTDSVFLSRAKALHGTV